MKRYAKKVGCKVFLVILFVKQTSSITKLEGAQYTALRGSCWDYGVEW